MLLLFVESIRNGPFDFRELLLAILMGIVLVTSMLSVIITSRAMLLMKGFGLWESLLWLIPCYCVALMLNPNSRVIDDAMLSFILYPVVSFASLLIFVRSYLLSYEFESTRRVAIGKLCFVLMYLAGVFAGAWQITLKWP